MLAFGVSVAHAQRGTISVIDTEMGVSGLSVNNTTGDLYVNSGSTVKVYDESGAFKFQFGSEGSGAGELLQAGPSAIDQVTGDFFVLDANNNRIDKFDAAGNFQFTFGWDVNQTQPGSAQELCPRPGFPADVCQAGERGTKLGQIGSSDHSFEWAASGLAIGTSGNLFVAEKGGHIFGGNSTGLERGKEDQYGNRRVQVFSPSGAFLSAIAIPHEPSGCEPIVPAVGSEPGPNECEDRLEPAQLAIDSQGTIYTTPDPSGVEGTFGGPICRHSPLQPCVVKRYSPSGLPLGALNEADTFGTLNAIAADTVSDEIYVVQPTSLDESQFEIGVYSSAGQRLESVARGIASSGALAVRSGTTRAYVGNQSGGVNVIDTIVVLPSATVDSISNVTAHGAEFHGTANNESTTLAAGYHFEYRAEGDASWTPVTTKDVDIGTGASPVPAEQATSQLDPNTNYRVRLVVTREQGGGSAVSAEQTFTTDPTSPSVALLSASRVTDTTARLGASVNPQHAATSYYFQYGTDTGYGNFAPVGKDGSAGGELGDVPAFQQISGLTPDTTYHYCIVTENAAGATPCEDQTFKTTTVEQQNWPARHLELVNEPDKGNQNAMPDFTSNFMTADGERVVWQTTAGAPDSTSGGFAPFISHRTPSGWVTTPFAPTTAQQPGPQAGNLDYQYVGANEDLDEFLFNATQGFFANSVPNYLIQAHTPDDQQILAENPATTNSYYWVRTYASSDLSSVVVEDEGQFTLYRDGNTLPLSLPTCGARMIRAGGTDGGRFISVTATRAFVFSPGDGDCGAPRQLYAIDLATNIPELISGPASGESFEVQSVSDPTTDGREIFFMTKTAVVAGDGNGGPDIYKWTAADGPSCVTCSAPGFSAASAGGMTVSKDQSHIYFNANGSLDSNPSTSCAACLYVMDVETGDIRFINPTGGAVPSADGQAIVFTGGDPTDDGVNTGPTPDETGKFGQVYHYSLETESMDCVSCMPDGSAPEGGIPTQDFVGRVAMSADGESVAFNTTAAILPDDINDTQDIYEWHNGVVRLVTDGVHEWPSNNLGGSPITWGFSADGRNLIFSVGGFKLTGEEHDSYANVYDARVGGGFAQQPPPAHCTEDACQGPLQAAPKLSQQGSSSFQGPASGQPTRAKARKKHHHKRHSAHKKRQRSQSHGRSNG
jgi:hypothetical protein